MPENFSDLQRATGASNAQVSWDRVDSRENFFDLERSAAARLIEAVQARSVAEVELTSVFQVAAEKAEREVARARKSNATARQSELSRIDETHASAESEIGRKYDAEQFTISRTREETRERKTEKYTTAEQRGRTEYKDRIWHIDSMLEAGEKAAKEQLESLQRKAAGGLERLQRLWTTPSQFSKEVASSGRRSNSPAKCPRPPTMTRSAG